MRGMLVLSETTTASIHRLLCQGDQSPPPNSATELLEFVRMWVQDQSLRQCEQCRRESAEFKFDGLQRSQCRKAPTELPVPGLGLSSSTKGGVWRYACRDGRPRRNPSDDSPPAAS